MAKVPVLQFKTCEIFGSNSKCFNFLPLQNRSKLNLIPLFLFLVHVESMSSKHELSFIDFLLCIFFSFG